MVTKGEKALKSMQQLVWDGLPVSILISPGSEHDSQMFIDVMESIKIHTIRGRPRSRPNELNADAAYDNKTIRSYLKRRGIKCNIPPNNHNRKNSKRGRLINLMGKLTGTVVAWNGSLDGLKLGSEDWQLDMSV